MKKILLLLSGSLIGALSFGQDPTVIHQGSYWFRYYNQTQLGRNFILHGELDERRFVNPDRQAQFFTHIHLHKKVRQWDGAVGFNYNLTNSNKNWNLAVPEYRPWQEINWLRNGKKVGFQARYRTEQRFIHHNDNVVLTDGFRFAWRHRVRLLLSFPLITKPNKNLALKLSEEIMLNTTSGVRTFDQNRVFISLEKSLSKKVSIEIGYLNLLQAHTTDSYFDRHVIRTTLYHRIDLATAKEGTGG